MGRRGAVWGGGAAPLETPGMGESSEGSLGMGWGSLIPSGIWIWEWPGMG